MACLKEVAGTGESLLLIPSWLAAVNTAVRDSFAGLGPSTLFNEDPRNGYASTLALSLQPTDSL